MILRALAACVLLCFSTGAAATLIDRGNGLIYDDLLDITWLSNARAGAGTKFDDGFSNTDGIMTWENALAWADDLVFGGFDDWRLPLMDVDLDGTVISCMIASEPACRDNELGYMYYYNLGGSFGDDLSGDQGPFTNIHTAHWSGTSAGATAWGVTFGNGIETEFQLNEAGAWAVRSGDVAFLPEPGVLALLGLGLAGLGIARRR